MGNNQTNKVKNEKIRDECNLIKNLMILVHRNKFDFLYVVGKGGFGKVMKYFKLYFYHRYGKFFIKKLKNYLH